jgi:hypothetical protein
MKRESRIVGVLFLVVLVPGGLVAVYEMHRAKREQRSREELHEARESQQALRDENKTLNLRLDDLRKAQEALQEENKNLNLRLEAEELGRLQSELERAAEELRRGDKEFRDQLRKHHEEAKFFRKELEERIRKMPERENRRPPWPGEIEPGRWNPLDNRYQDVPHPDATKRHRRSFS